MRAILFEQMDVAEVRGPPRTAEMAHRTGLRAGCGLDLTTCDEQDRPWDFNCQQLRDAAGRELLQDKPGLFIGSQVCGSSCAMSIIIYARMIEEEKRHRVAHGWKHLEFCMKFCEAQWREGRHFRHEGQGSVSS